MSISFAGASSVTSALLLSILGERPSLTSYSGVPDGTTDNSPQLQALINATFAAGGGVVFIPIGTYALHSYVTVPANIWLVGAGVSSKLIRSSTSTIAAGYGMLTVIGSGVQITDLLLDGNVTASTVVYRSSISTPEDTVLTQNSTIWVDPGISDFRMSRITIQHSGGYGLFIDVRTGTSYNFRLDDCTFKNNRPHTFSDGTTAGGSWTGNIYVAGVCSSGQPYYLDGLRINHCHWSRCTGNGLWSHSYSFYVQHLKFRVMNSDFTDMGLDGVEFGNVLGGGVVGCDFRRIGYLTVDDTTPSTPVYVQNYGAVCIDSSGYVGGVTHSNNTMFSVNGYGYNLDGFRNGAINGGSIIIPPSTDPLYSTDSVSGFGYVISGSLTQISKGIETGNSQQNGGAQNVAIQSVFISGMGDIAISLPFAKFCSVSSCAITHPSTALGVPVLLTGATGSTNPDEFACHNNVIGSNPISYAGNNACIAETGPSGSVYSNQFPDNVEPV